jgi:hypothetical protein
MASPMERDAMGTRVEASGHRHVLNCNRQRVCHGPLFEAVVRLGSRS